MVALYTTAVTAETITTSVVHTAHMFQAAIPKAYEVRLTVVGDRLFPVRIDAHSGAGRMDWRADQRNLTHTVAEVPDDVADGVHCLMDTFGLVFGAIDFVVTPDGHWTFLEVNPNGQWAWDHPLLHPIADALADELSEGIR